jgi:hypothetical protein
VNSAQESDLTPIFGDSCKSEKFYKIPPLEWFYFGNLSALFLFMELEGMNDLGGIQQLRGQNFAIV